MQTLKFHKTECGVEFLLNVIHLGKGEVNKSYLKNVSFNTDFFEVFFFKKAKGHLILNHKRIDLTDNSIVFISPFQKRQWNFATEDQEFSVLLFREDFLNEFFEDKLFSYRLLYFYQFHYPLCINLEQDSINSYCTLLKEIKTELIDTKVDSIHIVRSLLYYILHKLNREYAALNALSIDRQERHYAFQFKFLIEKHIEKKHRVNDYAELLGISRVLLNAAVKEQFNVTATYLVKERLLMEIKNYLIHSSLTVSEIAYKLNFSEPNHLMRFFKTQTGGTTREFLQENKLRSLDPKDDKLAYQNGS